MASQFEKYEKHTSAVQWCLCAKGYLETAGLIEKQAREKKFRLRFDLPLLMLIGQGYELTLKANLLAAGISLEKISKFGHGLSKLMNAKDNRDLKSYFDKYKSDNAKLKTFKETLNLENSFTYLAFSHGPPYVLRYPFVHARPHLDAALLVEFGLALNKKIEPICAAKFKNG